MKNQGMHKNTILWFPTLLFLMIFLSGNQIRAGEVKIYSTGFESDEGFNAETVYNNTTIKYDGPEGQQWGTYYGTASTTDAISGLMSMQMRWYTTATENLGYTFTYFDLANVSKVVFKAASTNGLLVTVSYSTDGGTTYAGESTITLTGSAQEYTYNISATGEFPSVRLKFQIALPDPIPTSTSRLYVDDVVVYGIFSDPVIIANPKSVSGFTYPEGFGPSVSQSFSVSGANLDPASGNITVTGSISFEVSSDNNVFVSSFLIPYSGGELAATDVFVRLKSGLNQGTYSGEAIALTGGSAATTNVAVSGEVTAPPPVISIGNIDFAYSQDFNTLAQSGTGNLWSDGDIPGWFWQGNSERDPNEYGYIADPGTNITATGHSYGPEGSTDRAMGVLSGSGHDLFIGVQFVNNTGNPIPVSEILVSFVGEQWRSNAGVEGLEFGYKVSLQPITDITGPFWESPDGGDFFKNQQLNFDPIHIGSGTSLDGNSKNNQQVFSNKPVFTSGVLGVDEFLILRWSKTGTYSNGLAIDDFGLKFAKSIVSASDGNWDEGTTWSGGVIPGSDASVNIEHNVTINGHVEIANLFIKSIAEQPDGKLTISGTGSLTVNGGTTNDVGENGLVVKSGGSLIHNNGGVYATMERYIAGVGSATWLAANNYNGWHLIASPIQNHAVSGQWTPSGADGDYDFYEWSEFSDTWKNQKIPENDITQFQLAKGYLVAYELPDTKLFKGPLNAGDYDFTLLNTGGLYAGWNLAGNPFPSAFDFAKLSLPTGVGAVPQVWDESASSYVALDGGSDGKKIIPSLNGFMVYTTVNDVSLMISQTAKEHNSTPWYKSSSDERILLVVRDEVHGTSQQSTVRFRPDATEGFDLAHDAYFLQGFAPQFYSVAEGNKLSLNTLPRLDQDLVIPFGFIKNAGEEFNIELEAHIAGEELSLFDKKLGIEHSLTFENPYAFTANEGDDPMRFEIRFKSTGDATNAYDPEASLARIYAFNKTLVVEFGDTAPTRLVEMYDLSGRLLMQQSLVNASEFRQAIYLQPGVYVVRVSDNNKTQTERVFIQ